MHQDTVTEKCVELFFEEASDCDFWRWMDLVVETVFVRVGIFKVELLV